MSNPGREAERSLHMVSLMIVLVAAAACIAGALACLWKRRRDDDQVRHVLRLAMEIVSVGASVDADLATAGSQPAFECLSRRCGEYRTRAKRP